MQRNATRTGPGISRSPSAQRLTVRASTSSASAAATCDSPSAAMAARNSSADNDAIFANGQAGSGQRGAQRVERVRNTEGVGQAAIGAEQRQALRAVSATGDETNGVGGQGWDGDGLAHDPLIGPAALNVNNGISAAESSEDTALTAGGNLSLAAARRPIPRKRAGVAHATALRGIPPARVIAAASHGHTSQPAARAGRACAFSNP